MIVKAALLIAQYKYCLPTLAIIHLYTYLKRKNYHQNTETRTENAKMSTKTAAVLSRLESIHISMTLRMYI